VAFDKLSPGKDSLPKTTLTESAIQAKAIDSHERGHIARTGGAGAPPSRKRKRKGNELSNRRSSPDYGLTVPEHLHISILAQ